MSRERSKFWQIGLPVLLIIGLLILLYAVMQMDKIDGPPTNQTQTFTVSDQERSDFDREIEEQLSQTEAEIEELGNKINDLDDKANQEMKDALQALEDQREVLEVKLKQAGQVSAELWAQFKIDVGTTINKFQEGAKDLAAKIEANIEASTN